MCDVRPSVSSRVRKIPLSAPDRSVQNWIAVKSRCHQLGKDVGPRSRLLGSRDSGFWAEDGQRSPNPVTVLLATRPESYVLRRL